MGIEEILRIYNKVYNTKLIALKRNTPVSQFAPGLKAWAVEIRNANTNKIEHTVQKTMIQEPCQDPYTFLEPEVLMFLFKRKNEV